MAYLFLLLAAFPPTFSFLLQAHPAASPHQVRIHKFHWEGQAQDQVQDQVVDRPTDRRLHHPDSWVGLQVWVTTDVRRGW